MTMFEDAAIIGLGLVGGSLARDLSARGVRVRAYDIDERHLRDAVQAGCVHESMDRSLAGVSESDLIVVAVPVDSATEVLRHIAPRAARAKLITDVGSTKCASSSSRPSSDLHHVSLDRIRWRGITVQAGVPHAPDWSMVRASISAHRTTHHDASSISPPSGGAGSALDQS